jgi:hypothetical protein
MLVKSPAGGRSTSYSLPGPAPAPRLSKTVQHAALAIPTDGLEGIFEVEVKRCEEFRAAREDPGCKSREGQRRSPRQKRLSHDSQRGDRECEYATALRLLL